MDSFELNHAKDILAAHFRWARGGNTLPSKGHCLSIEWKYKNGREDVVCCSVPKYKEEPMTIVSKVLILMLKETPKVQKLILLHYRTRVHERKIARSLSFPYQRYDAELDRAHLLFYTRLKKYCANDKFRRLFLV